MTMSLHHQLEFRNHWFHWHQDIQSKTRFIIFPVLPELFCQKSPVLAIFWQKSAFCRHHPCFIAFLCGNVLAKYRQMAKIGDFGHFSVLQNRRFGDKSPLLAILRSKAQDELFCLQIALFLSLDDVSVHLIPDDLW